VRHRRVAVVFRISEVADAAARERHAIDDGVTRPELESIARDSDDPLDEVLALQRR
jgi:hypothetical protein